MPGIPFAKYQGAGNDFLFIDNRAGLVPDASKADLARAACPRRTAVGGDGLVFIEDDPKLDFRWDFYNADGSSAEMCGNAARCAALYASAIGIAGSPMRFRTVAGPIRAELTAAGARVQLTDADAPGRFEALPVAEETVSGWSVNTGVPHAVLPVEDLEAVDLQRIGAAVRYHERFAPAGTNVNVVTRLPEGGLAIRTYERGVEGETLACGTGVTAAAIVAAEAWDLRPPVSVRTRVGDVLRVDYRREGDRIVEVTLEGPARRVYTGEIDEAFLAG
jgi:diaminopimelate epimerase